MTVALEALVTRAVLERLAGNAPASARLVAPPGSADAIRIASEQDGE